MSLAKLSKMELLAFKNALRLHYDSIELFKIRSYPSAYFLSILAMEEYGKAEALGHYVFGIETGDGVSEKDEEDFMDYIHRGHRWKQVWFLHNRGPFYKKYQRHDLFQSKFIKNVLDGDMESLKHNSVYVGLRKDKKGKVLLNSKLVDPVKISKIKAKHQITVFNNNLIDWSLGLYIGKYGHDNEEIRRILTRKLAKKLSVLWSIKDEKMEKFLERYNELGYKGLL